jgi:hypothetical protein
MINGTAPVPGTKTRFRQKNVLSLIILYVNQRDLVTPNQGISRIVSLLTVYLCLYYSTRPKKPNEATKFPI